MRFARVIASVAVSALCTVGVPAAHAANLVIEGILCGTTGSTDPTGTIANPGTVVAEIDAGPVTAVNVDDPLYDPRVWIVCNIQVNAPTHAGANAAHAEGWGYGVAYLPPTVVSYPAAAGDDVYMCNEVWVFTGEGHVSVYLDDATGEFSTDPNTATCNLMISQEIPPQEAYEAVCPIAANVPEVYNEVCDLSGAALHLESQDLVVEVPLAPSP